MRSRVVGIVVAGLVVAACATPSGSDDTGAPTPDDTATDAGATPAPVDGTSPTAFPPGPSAPDGPLDTDVQQALDDLAGQLTTSGVEDDTLQAVGSSGDPRVLWPLSDVLRFTQGTPTGETVLEVADDVVDIDIGGQGAWTGLTNILIAWDLPAPPGYVDFKGELFTALEPGWEPFFADRGATIDWRQISWGGVLIDDRPLGADAPCDQSCIPALDDPAVTDAARGDWYADDRLVFAVEVDGEARAYPKHIMEVHEMVNDTVGGVRLGIPYCTLCGAAQAYVTEDVASTDEPLVLRTSGLLRRSNKVMYDLDTSSVFDTFTGEAVSGPLREAGVELEPVTVVTATWGEWRDEHPDTTIVAEDGGLGREYDLDPLGGRDDDGPIFPVGDVDPRLDVQAKVVGVVRADGGTVAFDADAARAALDAGEEVAATGVELIADGGGLRARTVDGGESLAANEAFWFAWSQFHPDTALWPS